MALQHVLRPLECEVYLPALRAATKEEAIREIVGRLALDGKVERADGEEIVAAILRREELGSTGIGGGFAVPHAKHRSATRALAAMALSSRGIDFQSLDGRLVHVIVLVLSPADGRDHLRTLERVSRWIRQTRTS